MSTASKTPPVVTWDFTYFPSDDKFDAKTSHISIARALCADSLEWGFQLERASTGGIHYQGRLRLRAKKRLMGVKSLFAVALPGAHWSPTSTANSKNFNYVAKADTRVEGPWLSKTWEEPKEKTDDVLIVEERGLYLWQNTIVTSCAAQLDRKTRDRRIINCVIDTTGNIGKSTLVGYMQFNKLAACLPPVSNFRELMGYAMAYKSHAYIFDMPRAMAKNHLQEFYAGVERIKDGQLSDPRYKSRMDTIERPAIWIFTNKVPDTKMLSADRWRFWQVRPGDWSMIEYMVNAGVEEAEEVEDDEAKEKAFDEELENIDL